MPYGAHEAMEVHEILQMKQFLIEHFSMYLDQTMDPTLREILHRHVATAVEHYNYLVSYTHDYHTAQTKMMPVHRVQTFDVQYGIRETSQVTPDTERGRMSERSRALSMLQIHKNSAVMHMKAALECADPNLRQIMVNGSMMCEQQAYEVFNYMNHKGWYQVPGLNPHATDALLHAYQPVPPGMTGMMEPTRESGWGMARSDIAQPQGRTGVEDPGKQTDWGKGTTDFPTNIGNGNTTSANIYEGDYNASSYSVGSNPTGATANRNDNIGNVLGNNTMGNNTVGNNGTAQFGIGSISTGTRETGYANTRNNTVGSNPRDFGIAGYAGGARAADNDNRNNTTGNNTGGNNVTGKRETGYETYNNNAGTNVTGQFGTGGNASRADNDNIINATVGNNATGQYGVGNEDAADKVIDRYNTANNREAKNAAANNNDIPRM